jgi:hypothetical protein
MYFIAKKSPTFEGDLISLTDCYATSSKENGGYVSVKYPMYAETLNPHRITPTEKPCIPAGYFPVNNTIHQAMNRTNEAAMDRKYKQNI